MSAPLSQILSDIGPAFQIAGAVAAQVEMDIAEFNAGQAVSIPTIYTYLGGKQVAVDLKITPVAAAPVAKP